MDTGFEFYGPLNPLGPPFWGSRGLFWRDILIFLKFSKNLFFFVHSVDQSAQKKKGAITFSLKYSGSSLLSQKLPPALISTTNLKLTLRLKPIWTHMNFRKVCLNYFCPKSRVLTLTSCCMWTVHGINFVMVSKCSLYAGLLCPKAPGSCDSNFPRYSHLLFFVLFGPAFFCAHHYIYVFLHKNKESGYFSPNHVSVIPTIKGDNSFIMQSESRNLSLKLRALISKALHEKCANFTKPWSSTRSFSWEVPRWLNLFSLLQKLDPSRILFCHGPRGPTIGPFSGGHHTGILKIS